MREILAGTGFVGILLFPVVFVVVVVACLIFVMLKPLLKILWPIARKIFEKIGRFVRTKILKQESYT